MNERPKLFISHSSAEDELAQRVIADLRQRVGETFDILLDAVVLEGGQRWRDELWNWWSDCDVAVVVCSNGALQSRWVLIETSILMRRKRVNPGFPLLPLVVDPVTPEKVKEGLFHDQELTELQATRIDNATFGQQMIALAAKLAPFGALDRTTKPLARWEERLAAVLEKTNDSDLLRDVAASLGATAATWTGLKLQARIVARAMLESDSRAGVLAAVNALRTRLDAASIIEIVDLVAPTWLASSQVATVRDVVNRPAGSRGVGLPSYWSRAAQWYVQRAASRYPLAPAIPFKMPRQADDVNEAVANIVASIRETLHIDEEMSEEVVRRRLQKKDAEREPVFVLIPVSDRAHPARIEAELLAPIMAAINDRFATLGFFVLAGRPPAELGDMKTNGRVVFLPDDEEAELALSEDYSAALS